MSKNTESIICFLLFSKQFSDSSYTQKKSSSVNLISVSENDTTPRMYECQKYTTLYETFFFILISVILKKSRVTSIPIIVFLFLKCEMHLSCKQA